MPNDIIAFQAGREARIAGEPRDGRRSVDWLEGWDHVHADYCRWDEMQRAKYDQDR